MQPLLSENVTSFFSNGTSLLDKVIRYILGLAGNILSHIPDGALSLGTAVISSFLISARLPKIKSWLKKRLPEEKLKPAADALKLLAGGGREGNRPAGRLCRGHPVPLHAGAEAGGAASGA